MSAMIERPLDQIRKETKIAHRAPHLRKNHITPTDLIDSLDNITGVPYHHDGPYDATLASRNRNPKNAPVEAVKTGNMEALKATPYENLQDSLTRHVPLSGTAVVPPGEEDLAGRIMNYEEGADLMREDDAPGGPYRRWKDYDFQYHPDDLKGKAEPSYSIERRLKEQNRVQGDFGTGIYEMQPGVGSSKGENANVTVQQPGVYEMQTGVGSSSKGETNVTTRPRSSSSAGPSSSVATGSGINRSHTTGKRLSAGLKRRIGSLRRKSPDHQ